MLTLPSPLHRIDHPLFAAKEVEVWVKRDDMIHPYIMGNKWRKLKFNLEYAKKHNFQGILTLGGAFSNHIAATAAACHEHKLLSIGIIRGEELSFRSNPTLRFASSNGMHLRFVSRSEYREFRNNSDQIGREYEDYYVLPEGGTNYLAIKGCQEVVDELPEVFDYIAVPIGTGGTFCGLLKAMEGKGLLVGYSCLKGDFIHDEILRLRKAFRIKATNYEVVTDYHFGGYAKMNDRLIEFINRTKEEIDLLLDPIYTGKMYFGVIDMISKGFFKPKSKLVIVHTGGLQGIAGYNEIHQKKITL